MPDGRKDNGGHSTKGKAGRKSKADEERIRDILSPYQEGAIKTMVEIMQNGKKDSDRLSASVRILEWMWGKPKQQTDVTSGGETINTPVFTWADDQSQS